MAASYEKLGIYGDALKAYQKVLEIDPENSYGAGSLASIKDVVTSKGMGSAIATDNIAAVLIQLLTPADQGVNTFWH